MVLKNYNKFRELSNGGLIQGFKRAEKSELTKQEMKVDDFLKKLKINYNKHQTLETSIGKLNFDFWLPEINTIIECTESKTKDKAESLSYRLIKLKDKLNLKSIIVINENVSNGFIRRLSEFDYILFNNEISKLGDLIRLCSH